MTAAQLLELKLLLLHSCCPSWAQMQRQVLHCCDVHLPGTCSNKPKLLTSHQAGQSDRHLCCQSA